MDLNDYREDLLEAVDFEAMDDKDYNSYDKGIAIGYVDGESTGYQRGNVAGRQSGWVSGYEDAVCMFNHDYKNYVEDYKDVDVDYLLDKGRPCD